MWNLSEVVERRKCAGRKALASMYGTLEAILKDGIVFLLCHWARHLNCIVTANYTFIFWMETIRHSRTGFFLIELSQLQQKLFGICLWVYQIAKYSGKPMCQPLRSSTTEVFCFYKYDINNTLSNDLPPHAHKWSRKVKSGIALRSCWAHCRNGLGEMNGVVINARAI